MSTQHKTVVHAFVDALQAMRRCEKSGNAEWHGRWSSYIAKLQSDLPHGGGLDGKVEWEKIPGEECSQVYRTMLLRDCESGLNGVLILLHTAIHRCPALHCTYRQTGP